MMIRLKKKKHSRGFTVAELLVVVSILSAVLLITTGLYATYSSSERKLRAENDLYEETRFALERVVKEFREGSIDYEEYWNQAKANAGATNCTLYSNASGTTVITQSYGIYGECYKDYALQFYQNQAGDASALPLSDDLSLGQNPRTANTAAEQASVNAVSTLGTSNHHQDELYIINNAGNGKTLIRCNSCDGNSNNGIGKLQILELTGHDVGYSGAANAATLNDGIIDKWVCSKDFTCSGGVSDGTPTTGTSLANTNDGWVDYSPSSLDITDLQFYIAPLEDPHKAYNEDSADVQMQPHLSIILTAKLSEKKDKGLPGDTPMATLQTTVSGRVFSEIK